MCLTVCIRPFYVSTTHYNTSPTSLKHRRRRGAPVERIRRAAIGPGCTGSRRRNTDVGQKTRHNQPTPPTHTAAAWSHERGYTGGKSLVRVHAACAQPRMYGNQTVFKAVGSQAPY